MKCKAQTKKGRRCKHRFADVRDYCFIHTMSDETVQEETFFDIDKFISFMISILLYYTIKDGMQSTTSSLMILSKFDNFTDCY